jgi:hypothetical protein
MLEVGVGPLDQLEVYDRIGDPDGRQLVAEGRGAEIEVELVARAGIDPDPAQAAKRIGVAGNHADRVAFQPSVPHLGDESPGRRVERDPDRAVRIGGVAGGHGPHVQDLVVAAGDRAYSRAEGLPELVERPLVLIPQAAGRLADIGQVAGLEQRVAGIASAPNRSDGAWAGPSRRTPDDLPVTARCRASGSVR